MGGATVIEKYRGSAYVSANIYSSAWFVALWTILAISATAYLLRRRVQRRPVTFMLHISMLVILAGAGITWLWGKEGMLHIREGVALNSFIDTDSAEISLDAVVAFKDFNVVCYPGTDTPKTFECQLSITDTDGTAVEASVALNRVLNFNGVRYFLTSFDDDGSGVTLSVSKNRWGMGVSYTGYALLMLSMLVFLFRSGTRFKALRNYKSAACIVAIFALSASSAEAAPRAVSEEVADAFGNLHVYYNGRICPMNTVSTDISLQLYDSRGYDDLNADQVLASWIFFPSEWIETVDTSASKETEQTVSMIISADILKIFPYQLDGIKWASPATRVDASIPAEQRMFMRRALDFVSEQIVMGNDSVAVNIINKIREYQIKIASDALPSSTRFSAEKIYNSLPLSLPLAIFCIVCGLLTYIFSCRYVITGKEPHRWFKIIAALLILRALIILSLMLVLRGYISGHWPMTNGFETMQCMAWCALVGAIVMRRRFAMARPFGLIVAGMALLVAMMGQKNPAVTYITPVLDSPWLCLHVMLVMVSYSLLAFVMLGGVTGLILNARGKYEAAEKMAVVGIRVLYPAVFALTAGIFVGAIWANETWGRFWGWDPKEVWALITMLVYAAPLHSSFRWLDNGARRFHIYAIAAFLCVAITYFGVNYLLGGLHSYAN